MSLRRLIFTLSAVSTLTLAACGGGDSPESPTPSSSSSSTTATSGSSSSSSSAPEGGPNPTAGRTPETVEPAPAVDSAPTATCATDFTLYQPGTTFYSDGTSGYTASCQQQMEDAMEASGQFPDYPFGNVDPNWTEDDVFNRGGSDSKYYDPEFYYPDGTPRSSGEIQTRNGCEDGYITGPECDAVLNAY